MIKMDSLMDILELNQHSIRYWLYFQLFFVCNQFHNAFGLKTCFVFFYSSLQLFEQINIS